MTGAYTVAVVSGGANYVLESGCFGRFTRE